MLIQQIINGLVVGGVYALFAVGLNFVFGIHRILNLAHGAVFMIGAFAALTLVEMGVPFLLAALIALVFGGMLGVAIELLAFRKLRRSGEEEFGAIISSIGANMVLVTLAQRWSETQVLRFPFDTFPIEIFTFWGLRLSLLQLFILATAIVLVSAMGLYLYKTAFGRDVRTVAGNQRAALLCGINPNVIFFQTFFISGALAAAAGVLVGLAFNSIHFLMGEPYLLRGFIVIILGGLGSVPGALIAGLSFGMIQTLTTAYLPTQLGDAIVFSLLFLILIIRPNGLLGREIAGSMRSAR
jgi:branched-chain amino acid transport system permease protein